MSSSESFDILNSVDTVDLSTVRTSLPFLPTGIYEVTLAEATLEQQKAPKVGYNLAIKVTTNFEYNDVDSKPVNLGFPLFDRISLVKTTGDETKRGYDPIPRLVEVYEALYGTKEGNMTPKQIVEAIQAGVGRPLKIQVTYTPDAKDRATGESYGPQNRIKRYVKP